MNDERTRKRRFHSCAYHTAILEWAAAEHRIVLTHDVSTMTGHAISRIAAGIQMPGLFAISQSAPTSQVIEDLVLIAECSEDFEWNAQIHYLPFK